MLPTFAPSARSLADVDTAVLALPVRPVDDVVSLCVDVADLEHRLGADLTELIATSGLTGAAGDLATLPFPDLLIHLVGVGDGEAVSLRRAGATLARRVRGAKTIASAVHLGAADPTVGLTAFVTGAILGSFRYTLRTDDQTGQAPVERVVLVGGGVDPAVLERAETIAGASWRARELATVPSNIKNPAWLAAQAEDLAREAGLACTVWDEAALAVDGFGGILAVGSGSATPPRLVRLDYTPPRATRRTPHVVLVGKGITFDSGGLSIKPAEAMSTMKRDMTGGAVVLATMSVLAALDCPVKVSGIVPMAENAVGAASMRPGDVITHWGGRTTEVTNTDAEGRLVLADALAYAVDKIRPDVIVDVATLTGAMKVALGLNLGGFFATDDQLADVITRASEESGERLWRMPLAQEYAGLLASRVADADNAPGKAGAITAALFLQPFTDGVPWVHLDIASVGDSAKDNAEWTPGPTGFGVRLLAHWLGAPEPLEGVI